MGGVRWPVLPNQNPVFFRPWLGMTPQMEPSSFSMPPWFVHSGSHVVLEHRTCQLIARTQLERRHSLTDDLHGRFPHFIAQLLQLAAITVRTQAHTRTTTHTRTHARTHSHARTRTHAHTRTRTRTRTHTRARTHTNTQTHRQTH